MKLNDVIYLRHLSFVMFCWFPEIAHIQIRVIHHRFQGLDDAGLCVIKMPEGMHPLDPPGLA